MHARSYPRCTYFNPRLKPPRILRLLRFLASFPVFPRTRHVPSSLGGLCFSFSLDWPLSLSFFVVVVKTRYNAKIIAWEMVYFVALGWVFMGYKMKKRLRNGFIFWSMNWSDWSWFMQFMRVHQFESVTHQ